MKILPGCSIFQSFALALAIVCVLLCPSCAVRQPLTHAPDPTVLLEADRAFAVDTATRRLEGWMAWFTEDAIKLSLR